MAERAFPVTVYVRLKTLTRALVDSFGAQKAAEIQGRAEQPQISNYVNENRLDRFVPIDVALDWFKRTGELDLLEEIGRLVGCLMVRLPNGGDGEVEQRSARSAQEFGDVIASIMSALADRKFTETEGETVLRQIHELMLELAGLAEAVRAKVEADALLPSSGQVGRPGGETA